MMRGGELRHLVELQEDTRTATPGTRGEIAESWTTRIEVWAGFDQQKAEERLSFNQQYPWATYAIESHWDSRAEPTPSWRIKARLNGKVRYFYIVNVENVKQLNERWRFICGEQVAVRDGDT